MVQVGLGPQLAGGVDNVEGGPAGGVQGVGQGVVLGVGGRDGLADVLARRRVLVHVACTGLDGNSGGSFGATGAACTLLVETACALLPGPSPSV